MTGAEALPHPADEPELVAAAADRCARLAAVAAAVAAELARDAERLAAAWSGPAAVGCRAELGAATRMVASLPEPLHRSAAQLREHGEVLREARAEVDRLRTAYDERLAADRRDLAALPGGSPSGPVRRLQAADLLATQQLELAALHRRHQDVLDRVDGHARATARRITAAAGSVGPVPRAGGAPVADREAGLAALLPLLSASRLAAGVPAGPPAGTSPPPAGTAPGLVRQWWAALTGDERDRAVLAWPAELGALDGLPATARSTANERRLERDVAALTRQPNLTPEQRRWLGNCLAVRQQLAAVRADGEVAQLLVFDPTAFGYQGRAAIAAGDVDTADNVAFLVPGLGTDVLDSTAGLTGTALRVEAEAHRVTPAETTATVAWLGYDAPGLVGGAFDDAAEDGAELLAEDVLAVQAARQLAPHLTVVAHSYGTTTAGLALRDVGTGTDDLVLVGSPGAGVDRAADLEVPAGHVFVGASSRDPVSYVDRFGADPAYESFGAVRFEAETVGRSWHLTFGAHGTYFDPHSESLANIAHVVTGDYAGVVPAAYRDDVFLLPDGIYDDPESGREPTTVP